MIVEVIFYGLMSEEEIFVTPMRGDHAAIEFERADLLLGAAKFIWGRDSINFIEGRISRHCLQLVYVVHVGILSTCGELIREEGIDISVWPEVQGEREVEGLVNFAVLVIPTNILKTNILNPVSGL